MFRWSIRISFVLGILAAGLRYISCQLILSDSGEIGSILYIICANSDPFRETLVAMIGWLIFGTIVGGILSLFSWFYRLLFRRKQPNSA